MRNIRSTGTVRAALVAVLMVVTGCGSSSGGGDSMGKEVLSNLSEFEVRALGDKVVTYAEMEEAGQIVVECMEAHGIEDAEFHFAGGSMIYEGGWSPREGMSEEEEAAYTDQKDAEFESCVSLANAVTSVWDLQNQGSEEEKQAVEDAFVACVIAAGIDIPADSDVVEAATAVREYEKSPSFSEEVKAAAEECMFAISNASVVAPDGLAEALAELDLSAYD